MEALIWRGVPKKSVKYLLVMVTDLTCGWLIILFAVIIDFNVSATFALLVNKKESTLLYKLPSTFSFPSVSFCLYTTWI